MAKFHQGLLNDMDVISCWLLSQDSGESLEKLIAQRKRQKHEELIQLAEDVRKIGISKQDFERQGRIFLTAQEHKCSMKQAEEYLTLLEEMRTKKDSSAYGKIADFLKLPKYSTTEEKPQKEEVEILEWIPSAGFISRYDEIKRKRREVKR